MLNYDIKYIQDADSTNDYMKRLMLKKQLTEGTVILAEYQKSGKGRGMNTWYSGNGLNLTFSVLLYPEIHADKFFYLTEFISLSITDFLKSYGIKASVKWPNDIYVEDNKIAGILIENTIINNRIVNCIAGIGLNVNEIEFPSLLPNPTSMKMLLQNSFEKQTLLGFLLDTLRIRYQELRSDRFESLHKEYNKQLYKKGLTSRFQNKKGFINAKLIEIMPSGELILRHNDNTEEIYLFDEIDMII